MAAIVVALLLNMAHQWDRAYSGKRLTVWHSSGKSLKEDNSVRDIFTLEGNIACAVTQLLIFLFS